MHPRKQVSILLIKIFVTSLPRIHGSHQLGYVGSHQAGCFSGRGFFGCFTRGIPYLGIA
jgi:hypothetical protein